LNVLIGEYNMNSQKKFIPPVYIKTEYDEFWSEDGVFYILGSNGLFLCRNQKFFTSCVPANNWPCALGKQESFLKISYPLLPRRLLELAVGFFDAIYNIYRAEATMLLLWDETRQKYKLLVPNQKSIVFENWKGRIFPLSVQYEIPVNLKEYIIGDLHCHCEANAFSSMTDQNDETHRAGLHIVVGQIDKEPPEFHIECVVDRVRFEIMPENILEGYRKRRKGVPLQWVEKVEIIKRKSCQIYTYKNHNKNSFKNHGMQ
jgi:hypothetical protein